MAAPIFGRICSLFERDLIEQGAAERVAKAALVASCLWLAIWWALS